MDIILNILAFACGCAVTWVFKASVLTELGSLHAKIDGAIAAIKAK